MNEQQLMRAVAYQYPAEARKKLMNELQPLMEADNAVYVVIDDDPTGGQTVHDIDVYTEWSQEILNWAIAKNDRMFYIMTNSRSLTEKETTWVHEQITARLAKAAQNSGKQLTLISRGDSTLRGHYPVEVELLQASLPEKSKQLLIPFFREGNRFTIENVHYLKSGEHFIPVGESEFGCDKSFGYHSSDLSEWIEEKTAGKVSRAEVDAISLDMIRAMDFETMERILCGESKCIVVNATCDDDLRSFAVAYLRACQKGYHFVARTAAAWPKVIGNIADQPLLEHHQLVDQNSTVGGLIVVGSHVRQTTRQLDCLLAKLPQLKTIELNQHLVVEPTLLAEEVQRVAKEASNVIQAGQTCVIYTRRERLDLNGTEEEELLMTQRIADAVSETVGAISVKPRFLVAKGGITSSDIATKSLQIKRATIIGQIEPGVPVWMPATESRYQTMPYIIFPGNVGNEDTLLHAVQKLM